MALKKGTFSAVDIYESDPSFLTATRLLPYTQKGAWKYFPKGSDIDHCVRP